MLIFSLREQIVEQLRNDVLCGRLAEGEKLSESKLVERFGVSRTPIREALQQLMHEGLLEGRPNTGVKVAKRPPNALRELVIPIRRSVETFALRSYFSHIQDEDYAKWNAILAKLKGACEAGDFASIAEFDIELHRSIVQRAKQKDLEAIWMSLVARVRSHFWQTQRKNYTNPLEIYEEHAKIIESFRSSDVEEAVKALAENIQ